MIPILSLEFSCELVYKNAVICFASGQKSIFLGGRAKFTPSSAEFWKFHLATLQLLALGRWAALISPTRICLSVTEAASAFAESLSYDLGELEKLYSSSFCGICGLVIHRERRKENFSR